MEIIKSTSNKSSLFNLSTDAVSILSISGKILLIFAETNENITRSEAENSLIEASGATNVEKKEEQPTNQEIGTELDTDWEIGTVADYFEKRQRFS